MKKRKVLAAVLLAALLFVGAYTCVSAAGTADDPLVTLSYLTQIFTPQMEEEMEAVAEERADALSEQLEQMLASSGTGSVFRSVTLSRGQALVCGEGCEVLLRTGSASYISDAGGSLSDTTGGAELDEGAALQQNHLYLASGGDGSVVAVAESVTLMARGPFTVA